MVFIPRKYRHYKVVLYLMIAECPIVLPVLILTGIAAHNTYTSKLWQDGANNGFNSAPNQIVYALTNGRTYQVPIVWSSFLNNYNLVLGVLSTFILLTKLPVHVMHFFHPPVSAIVHGSLCALYAAAASFQAGSDTTDPRHPQNGPPWYITKPCSVAYSPSNIGYCQQAKSLFAVTVIATFIYFVQTVLALISCFVTKEERAAYRRRQEEKREERDAEDRALREYDEIIKSPAFFPGMPNTPGFTPGLTPMPNAYFPGQQQQQPPLASPYTPAFGGFVHHPTPVTTAFSGHHQHTSSSSAAASPSSDLPLRNANFDASTPSFGSRQISVTEVEQPYFPPPPKKATK